MSDENSKESNQKNAAAIKMMMRIGSEARVNTNIDRTGPKTRKVHPKNSATVILNLIYVILCVSQKEIITITNYFN